jgi:pimeloyl-ACP methyl ester carboxylesterase
MNKAKRLVAAGLFLLVALMLLSSGVLAKGKAGRKAAGGGFPVVGRIFDVDVSGFVAGTAYIPNNEFHPPTILYTVTNLGSIYDSNLANLGCVATPENYCPGNRGFVSQIPPEFCDGNQHVLRVYAFENLGPGFNSPFDKKVFTCYAPDPNSTPPRTPVVFVPGIAGSVLKERNRSFPFDILWPEGLFTPGNIERMYLTSDAEIYVPDVVRSVFGSTVYGSFIDRLKSQGDYDEYDVAGIPERRDTDCQVAQQRPNKPTLFVFAYDWRQSVKFNAGKLREYVQCVQKFYPTTKVNIVAHSMGGMVARRYLLDNSLNHHVDQLITIGTPWLGAPKAIDAVLSGRFLTYPGTNLYIKPDKIQTMALYAKGVHELLPSGWYYALGGRPLEYQVNDGTFTEPRPALVEVAPWLDSNFPASPFDGTRPYQNSLAVHDYPTYDSHSGQDDWRQDLTDVFFTHITGEKFGIPTQSKGTIGAVSLIPLTDRTGAGVRSKYLIMQRYTYGDGTVPTLSALRQNGGVNLNGPGYIPYTFNATNSGENAGVEHNGLMKNTEVADLVIDVLGDSEERNRSEKAGHGETKTQAKWRSYLQQKAEIAAQNKASAILTDPEKYFVSITGTAKLNITDSLGNTNTTTGEVDEGVPGVSYEYGSAPGESLVFPHQVEMPMDAAFDIKFVTSSDITRIHIIQGTSEETGSQAIKYLDLNLPEGVTAWLRFTTLGVEDLRYDADGDGNFESQVNPTYVVAGSDALDITEPTVEISKNIVDKKIEITITASDKESGLNDSIYYQIAGEEPQTYRAPFLVENSPSSFVTAFVDDRAGNRGSAFKYLDGVPPTTTIEVSPIPPPEHGWVNVNMHADLNSVDDEGGSGVGSFVYSAAGATVIPQTEHKIANPDFNFPGPASAKDVRTLPLDIVEEGITTLSFAARDKNGNEEGTQTHLFRIDYSKPRINEPTISINENVANITLVGTDVKLTNGEVPVPLPDFPVSGVATMMYSLDGGDWKLYSGMFTYIGTGAGTHTISYYATDFAGNVGTTRNRSFTLTASATPKSVTPVLECVGLSGSTYTARFGYINYNGGAVSIPVGTDNMFSPGSADRGQPTTFQSGQVSSAAQVTFTGTSITWTLKGPDNVFYSIIARRSSMTCN